MTTPFLCNVYIFDIRDGETGKKPGFLLLKAATEALVTQGPEGHRQSRAAATSNGAIFPAEIPSSHPPPALPAPLPPGVFLTDPAYSGSGARRLNSRSQEAAEKDIHDEDIIRVLVAGGDGTVMWCASEAEAHHIDPNKIALGVIPYGTGTSAIQNAYPRSLSLLCPYTHRHACTRAVCVCTLVSSSALSRPHLHVRLFFFFASTLYTEERDSSNSCRRPVMRTQHLAMCLGGGCTSAFRVQTPQH